MPKPPKPLQIRVPATTANLGPGFDGLGLALNLFNDFKITPLAAGKNKITGRGSCEGIAGDDNIFFTAYRRVLAMAGKNPQPISVDVDGQVPMARGLGSSATAIVAGVVAANEILGRPFDKDELLLAMTREEGHPDNVAPAFLGSLVAAVFTDSRVIVKVDQPHPSWRLAMLIPDYHLSTERARKAIPKTIPHRDAVFNLTRTPLVLDALIAGRRDILPLVIEDRLHEPYRKHLIAGYDEIRTAALAAGASGVYLSGAGPSLAAFCWGKAVADRVAGAMRSAVKGMDFGATALVLKPNLKGTNLKEVRAA